MNCPQCSALMNPVEIAVFRLCILCVRENLDLVRGQKTKQQVHRERIRRILAK